MIPDQSFTPLLAAREKILACDPGVFWGLDGPIYRAESFADGRWTFVVEPRGWCAAEAVPVVAFPGDDEDRLFFRTRKDWIVGAIDPATGEISYTDESATRALGDWKGVRVVAPALPGVLRWNREEATFR